MDASGFTLGTTGPPLQNPPGASRRSSLCSAATSACALSEYTTDSRLSGPSSSARNVGWDLVSRPGTSASPSSVPSPRAIGMPAAWALGPVPATGEEDCEQEQQQQQQQQHTQQQHQHAELPRLLQRGLTVIKQDIAWEAEKRQSERSWRSQHEDLRGKEVVSGVEIEESLYELQGVAPGRYFLRTGSWPAELVQHILRLLAIVCLVWTTFALTFGGPNVYAMSTTGKMALVDLSLDISCCLGVVLRLRTSLVDMEAGIEYLETGRIFVRSLRAPMFWMDAVSLLAILSYRQSLFNLRVFRLLRIWRLGAWLDLGMMADLEGERMKGANMVRLLELIVVVFILGHLFACVWFAVIFRALGEDAYPDDAEGGLSRHAYLFSLRDGLLILTESPNTAIASKDDPAISGMVLVLRPLGAFIMAWIFAELVVTIQRITILPSRQAEHTSLVNAAMRSLGLPVNLRNRIGRYHRYLEVHHNPAAYDALFSGLSVNLSVELKLYLYRKMVGDAPFFKDLTPAVLHKLLLGFREAVHSPGDVIIRKGDRDKEMYFIVRGKVDVLDDHFNLLAVKAPGDYFGEVALILKDTCRTACVRARSFCIVARLDQAHFFSALSHSAEQKALMINRIRSFHNVSPDDVHIPMAEAVGSPGGLSADDFLYCMRGI